MCIIKNSLEGGRPLALGSQSVGSLLWMAPVMVTRDCTNDSQLTISHTHPMDFVDLV